MCARDLGCTILSAIRKKLFQESRIWEKPLCEQQNWHVCLWDFLYLQLSVTVSHWSGSLRKCHETVWDVLPHLLFCVKELVGSRKTITQKNKKGSILSVTPYKFKIVNSFFNCLSENGVCFKNDASNCFSYYILVTNMNSWVFRRFFHWIP